MHQLWFTRWLNALFARPVDALLRLLHVAPAQASAPIPNHVAMEILAALIIALFAVWMRLRLSVEKPGAWQHMLELLWTGLETQAEEVIGHDAPQFMFFLTTLALLILVGNLMGLIPGLASPTAQITVTLGCALVTFVYYHMQGIRRQGWLPYGKTFLGPIPFLAFLLLPIEIISHLARILSLSVRLFANMFAGDLIIQIMMALFPVAGVVFMTFHFFIALLQAYIFVLLAMIYLAGAVESHHGPAEEAVLA